MRMCDKPVDNSLAALKLVTDSFVTSKMVEKLYTALYADENMLNFDEDSSNVVCSCNEMGIPNPDTIILIRLLAWNIKFEKRKALKKYKRKINPHSVVS